MRSFLLSLCLLLITVPCHGGSGNFGKWAVTEVHSLSAGCGTTAGIVGGDLAGRVTIGGTGITSACQVTLDGDDDSLNVTPGGGNTGNGTVAVKRTVTHGNGFETFTLTTTTGGGNASLTTPTTGTAGGGNTGNGTVTAVTAAPVTWQGNLIPGTYTLTCTSAAANSGTFSVVGPGGHIQEPATTMVGNSYFGDHINFTINDGAVDFVVGDSFTVLGTVAGGVFSVSGSVTGAMASAYVGLWYITDQLLLVLSDGAVDFISGDTFTIPRQYGHPPICLCQANNTVDHYSATVTNSTVTLTTDQAAWSDGDLVSFHCTPYN